MEAIAMERSARVAYHPLQRSGPSEARVLVVTTDDITTFKRALSAEPWLLAQARSSAEASGQIAADHFDVILLDAALYRSDDWSWLSSATTPTILISPPATQHEFGTILAARPADFLFKPFHAPELVVRIKKVLGRVPAGSSFFQSPNLSLDAEQRQCRILGKNIRLTAHETGFLSALLNAPRHFCTYEQLIEKIWGRPGAVETQNLRVLAVQLRKKVEPRPEEPAILVTVTGVGYRIQLP
ncbi:MAG TPA: response regulator transcription factor [Allosphingosinicella sp.]|uniref:response regulator transcription factor n=1 Tax=Allosphingosinicella sp. TaxID=2823234 RepID=UPI002EDAC2A2